MVLCVSHRDVQHTIGADLDLLDLVGRGGEFVQVANHLDPIQVTAIGTELEANDLVIKQPRHLIERGPGQNQIWRTRYRGQATQAGFTTLFGQVGREVQ